MSTQINAVRQYFLAFAERDTAQLVKLLAPATYVDHDPLVPEGAAGAASFLQELKPSDRQEIIRLFEDGSYVVAQSDGSLAGMNTFYDVFRFQNESIEEHWRFSAPFAPPNKSGHTQVDGPTQAKGLELTDHNKAFLRRYYETFHLQGDHEHTDEYFVEGQMARHEPGVSDGVQEFLQDVSVLMQHRTIDSIKLLLGQGDFVFLVAEGTHEAKPCLYIDLYRIENSKIVEHWGFPQSVPSAGEARNKHGLV